MIRRLWAPKVLLLLLTGSCGEGVLSGGIWPVGGGPPDLGPAWENPPPPPPSSDGGPPSPSPDGPTKPPNKPPTLPAPVPTCVGATPTSQTMVMGTQVYPIPDLAAPGKCQGVKDPVFHTLVSRVTHKSSDGYSDTGVENEYSKSDPENSDGTMLVLRGTEANWHLYSAVDFKRIKTLSIASGSQEAQPRWDASNPKLLYHLIDMRLEALNVDSGSSSLVHDFSGDVSGGSAITMFSEGDASVDRRYWCFFVEGADTIITYDKTANSIVGKKTGVTTKIDWLGMSMSGKHCVVGWDDGQPAKAFSRDFSKTVTLPAGTGGHADLSLTADGRDVLVYQNCKTDEIAMADLDTGVQTNLGPIPFTTNTDIGLHFSGNSAAIPGWHMVSTYGSKNPSGNHSWMDNHLFMIELKANPRIWRVASTRGYTSISAGETKHYFAEGFAAINTRGTRIYWGSNWGESDLDRIETFVAILPVNWPALIK